MTFADWLKQKVLSPYGVKPKPSGVVDFVDTGNGINTNFYNNQTGTSTNLRVQPYSAPQVLGTSAYAGGGGGGTTEVDPDAEAKTSAKNDILSKFKTLQDVFNGLFGALDKNAEGETNKLYEQGNRAQDELLRGFGKYNDQTNMQYGARGAYDSSYRGQALDEGNQVYERSLQDVGTSLADGVAGVGKNTANAKLGYQSTLKNYEQAINDVDQYGLGDLNNLQSSLDSTLLQGQQASNNYLQNPQAIDLLQGVSPIQQQGTAQLAAKLQNLITSSAPATAKKYIAQGLIKAGTLNDASAQSYWNSYFEDLLKSNGLG